MALPHGVHIFVRHRRRLDCRLEIERDEAGLHARFGEFLQHLVLGLADPLALPVLGERRDVRPLARDPLLGAGIAVQIDDSHYSITLSARSSSPCGMVMPMVLAAGRLMMSSNTVGSSTGSEEGLAPLAILSIYAAARRAMRTWLGPNSIKPPPRTPWPTSNTVGMRCCTTNS